MYTYQFYRKKTATNNLNGDLKEISKLVFCLKMSFNLDSSKQSQEAIFSRKIHKVSQSQILFYHVLVSQDGCQNQLGLILDSEFAFDFHIKSVMAKVSNMIDVIRKFQHVLPRSSSVTIYKAFIRSYLDYGDMFDQAFKDSFH